ncbi:signal recognition particle receptor subunit alpha [Pyrenophora tritici-repentis Pt-1C-BFP]|uniref:Signal recognition particle receptor subunit alpha homolog n=1 Tax=Pyrenophora tritici-repentis (strain Pt-1C-BFP) TaxID=426418 RepID=B2WPU3_PYRTR|nr:signal recognition particle receptor subunit alpha [Pyrenophora tritici-repentis Pt-1C-BFP]EDU46159.1 signal recognition particle receptor subunit alpha [Pyrenophora tritici-repentis Pt-1C-BFP]
MLDTFEVLTTSGVVLWSRTYVPVGANVINSLIRDVFIEERIQPQAEDAGSKPTYKKEGYTLKWTAAKDLGLIFVAVYQSLVHLTWIDKLLDNVRALFVGLYGEQLKTQNSSVVKCDKFGSYFDRQMQELEGASDSGTPSIKLITPESSTDNDSADETALKPPGLQKPQPSLYDTSADSTPVPTPDTSRPTTPAQSQLLTGKARPLGGKISRRDKKKASAFSSAPVSSGDEASAKKKGKGSKKGRVWGEFGADEEDDSVLDYSRSDIQGDVSGNEALEEIKQETWGRKTNKGEFVLRDLDDEMDAIIAEQNAKKDKDTPAAASGLVGSSLGAIGGLFRNVVGGKTLTKEDLAKPLKGMEEHLLRKNVAREAAVRLCESVERDLTLKTSMEKALTKILTPTSSLDLLREIQHTNSTTTRPYVLSIVGVNGVGKSTNLSKIAFFLLQNHHRVLIAAADTFRSGAVEQLRVHVDRLKELSQREGGHVDLFEKGYGKDAANIAADAVTFAAKNNFNIVLIDTAGRRHNDQRLMSSLEKFGKLANPDKILMVGEALDAASVFSYVLFVLVSRFALDGMTTTTGRFEGDKIWKTPSPSSSCLGWIKTFINTSDEFVLNHHSLDAYLYIRFLKVLTIMATVGAVITWPILLPVNAIYGGGQDGLNMLSFSNVVSPSRRFAHAIMAWVFFGWVMYVIGHEMMFLAELRKAYLLSMWNSSCITQRTVLFTGIPAEDLSLEKLQGKFQNAVQITLVPDMGDVEYDIKKLEKANANLEISEIKHLKVLNKRQRNNQSMEDKALRTTHRLKPLIGQKVDSRRYYGGQIKELLPKIDAAQLSHLAGKEKLMNAVFVAFDTMSAAETAFNENLDRRLAKFESRQMGVLREEVIWKNLGISSKNRHKRRILANLFITALIILWTIPVASIGSISSLIYLQPRHQAEMFGISNPIARAILTGLLPAILLAMLMGLVPVICRFVAKLSGAATLSEVEQQTQAWCFAFQVVQVFLVMTFIPSIESIVIQSCNALKDVSTLLIQHPAKSSNFYMSYFILYGLVNASRYLINTPGLLNGILLSKFDKTPRQMYMRYMSFSEPPWASGYSKWATLGVIALSHAVIAPLILGFAAIGLGLVYLVYKYNMLYVYDARIDSKGGFYARALEELMVGVYLGELCLLCLFALGPRVGYKQPNSDNTEASSQEKDLTGYPDGGITAANTSDTQISKRRSSRPDTALIWTLNQPTIHNPAAIRLSPANRSLHKKILPRHTPTADFPVPECTEQDVTEASLHPASAQREVVVWLARNKARSSEAQVKKSWEELEESGLKVTDCGFELNEKGRVAWEEGGVRTAPFLSS